MKNITILEALKKVFQVKAAFKHLPLLSFSFLSFRADHEKNDNVISAPFISHARPKRSNSITESSQTSRPYLPCWANIVLKSHAPIVLDESCTAQLDRQHNYNSTLCPCTSPFELQKCLQRKETEIYIIHPWPFVEWSCSQHCTETTDTQRSVVWTRQETAQQDYCTNYRKG